MSPALYFLLESLPVSLRPLVYGHSVRSYLPTHVFPLPRMDISQASTSKRRRSAVLCLVVRSVDTLRENARSKKVSPRSTARRTQPRGSPKRRIDSTASRLMVTVNGILFWCSTGERRQSKIFSANTVARHASSSLDCCACVVNQGRRGNALSRCCRITPRREGFTRTIAE